MTSSLLCSSVLMGVLLTSAGHFWWQRASRGSLIGDDESRIIGTCLNSLPVWNLYGAPDSKVRGAIMGPIWGRQDPGGPHVGPMKRSHQVTRFFLSNGCMHSFYLRAALLLAERPQSYIKENDLGINVFILHKNVCECTKNDLIRCF